ncbi:MAG: hypothetical protein HY812_17205 [Planctomycetes bacterium]|nr:hypothetical protein [Planctomycetota bacterium]
MVVLRTLGFPRLLGFAFDPVPLRAGKHRLDLEIVVPDQALFESVQLNKTGGPPRVVAGALEAEGLLVVSASPGLEHERQGMPADRWSGGARLWVKATKPGDLIELRVPVPGSGSYRGKLGLTKSWDYGAIAISLDGRRVRDELDLGVFSLGEAPAPRPRGRGPRRALRAAAAVLRRGLRGARAHGGKAGARARRARPAPDE